MQAAAPIPCSAGPGHVECDVCTGRKLKAVKSCLECRVSYCETHYKAHNELNSGRKHKVTDDTGQLQTHLGETKSKIHQIIRERENELQELRKAVETLESSAQTAVEDSERIFTEMIRSIERRRCEVKEIIRAQEKAEVSRAEGLQKRLEQEIAELKRRDAELEQLSHTGNHIHFLKTFPSVSESPEYKDLYCNYVNQGLCFEAVKKSVSSLKGQLEILCKEEVMKISAAVTEPQEPTTREDFLQYSCHFTLDPNTAHRNLFMSEGNRRVEMRNENQSYPDHPERFDGWCQVLCREGVSGRCYWEVEWSGSWGIHIAVVYKSIVRERGPESEFGHNDQSWSLRFSGLSSSSYFWHNNKQTKLHLLCSSRIGVYVNRRAGTLAFYSVSDTMTLLHRVQTTFTHTLYPGFVVGYQSSMKLL